VRVEKAAASDDCFTSGSTSRRLFLPFSRKDYRHICCCHPAAAGLRRHPPLLDIGRSTNAGLSPLMGPTDHIALFPALESLIDYSDNRDEEPGYELVLAESMDDDIANNRIVFHIKPGIKFQDGSDRLLASSPIPPTPILSGTTSDCDRPLSMLWTRSPSRLLSGRAISNR
jgi:hypothetical protein